MTTLKVISPDDDYDDENLIPIKLEKSEWENLAIYLLAYNRLLRDREPKLTSEDAISECRLQINQTTYLRNAILQQGTCDEADY